MSDLPFRLRPAVESDVGFIISTWLDGSREAWDGMRDTDVGRWATSKIKIGSFADLTRKFTRQAVVDVLQRESVKVVVACDVEEDDVVYGYAVAQPASRILHWAFVKFGFQKRGIGRACIDACLPDADVRPVTLTYLPAGFVTMQSKWPVRFDPHAR